MLFNKSISSNNIKKTTVINQKEIESFNKPLKKTRKRGETISSRLRNKRVI